MDNMKGFTVAIYTKTRRNLEVIKNKKDFTWDELLNYLMEVESKYIQEKPKQERQEE